jgi:integrase
LEGLQKDRCEVRESEPVRPVALTDVVAVKPHIARPLWGAIQFQIATASRPGEALRLRLGDVDRSGEVWVYRPGSHKTQHHGKKRIILIGPKGQGVVQEHLQSTDPDTYVFAVPGTEGKKHYRRDSYTNAIKRACEIAFKMPKELRKLKEDAPEDLREKAAAWRAEHCWHPHQLRHTAGTTVRASSDAETAQIVLGVSKMDVMEIYAERDLLKAAEIVKRIG